MGVTVEEALRRCAALIGETQVGSPRLDAEVLLAHLTEKDRTYLFVHNDEELNEEMVQGLYNLSKRRRSGVPVAYLTGEREFFGHKFFVSPAVLIPRPETELLVEIGVNLLLCRREDTGNRRKLHVLDLCTGSGAVAISLAKAISCAVTAQDISLAALEVAKKNSRALGTEESITFYAGDLYDEIPLVPRFDLIVANPPYIGEDSGPRPEQNVVDNEPHLALFAGPDGLGICKRIVAQAPNRLRPGGYLALEVGCDQALSVRALLEQRGFGEIVVVEDLAGHPRAISARWNG